MNARIIFCSRTSRWAAIWLLCAGMLLVLTGCGSDTFPGLDGGSEVVPTLMPAAPQGSGRSVPYSGPPTNGAPTLTSPALRAAYVAAEQASAPAEYGFDRDGAQTAIARCPVQGLHAKLGPGGLELAPTAHASNWGITLEATAIGRGDKLQGLPHPSKLEVAGNRASVERGAGIEEWYRNGRLGIEQGFVVDNPPFLTMKPDARLVLVVAVRGLEPSLSADGSWVSLKTSDGKSVLRYSDLFAHDATGRPLDARMEVVDHAVRLLIDDREAEYPVEIDPLAWVETQQFLPPAKDSKNFYFGRSVSVDGDTALVGASNESGAQSLGGTAYVFVRSGTVWIEQQKLAPSDGAPNDDFGWAVAVSGDVALIGAPADDDNGTTSGSAYVFVRSGAAWSQQQKLTAPDGVADDCFGSAVALDGNTALIGARWDDDMGTTSGSAYVFVRSGSTWPLQQKVTAGDGEMGDQFGYALSLYGNSALIGAVGDNDAGSSAGAAYVFIRSGTAWSQQEKLTSSDGALQPSFGGAVSLDVDTALIGAGGGSSPGSAYVFVRSGSTWSEQQKLIVTDGPAGGAYGRSVSVRGDTALVGAYADAELAYNAGSAYVFTRAGTTWSEQQKLTASDGAAGDSFGVAVSLSGDTALVGAYYDADMGAKAGSAYLLTRSGSTWTEQDKVLPHGVTASDTRFGYDVALHGNTALVGSIGVENPHVFVGSGDTWTEQQVLSTANCWEGMYALSLYGDTALVQCGQSVVVFVRNGSTWTYQQKLTGSGSDDFGRSASLYGDTAVVGAMYDNDLGLRAGAVYVFVRSGTSWVLEQKLTASDGATDTWFGSNIALYGDTALIGNRSGAVYAFERVGGTWSEKQKVAVPTICCGGSLALYEDTAVVGAFVSATVLVRSSGLWSQQQKLTGSHRFGTSVSLYGDIAVIGAYEDQGLDAGAAYVYARSGSTWSQQYKIMPTAGVAGGQFGWSLSLYDNVVLVGAPGENVVGASSGAAYVFRCGNAMGDTCTNATECGSAHCADAVCCNSECDGICMACTQVETGKPDGQCALIPSGGNPDGECAAGTCNGAGSCDPCGSPTECTTGHCVDSVCCDSDCSATCIACAQSKTGMPNGQCAVVPLGADPDNECGTGTEQSCDGAGTCRKELGESCSAGDACFSDQCVDGVCCDTSCSELCSACTAAKTGAVTGACSFVAAATDADSECGAGADQSCDGAGQCRKHNGQACSAGLECLTGFCTDGVCCDAACGALCAACVQLKTAGPDGTCHAIPLGQDPDDECAGNLGCHVEGQCQLADGQGCSQDDECKSSHCVDGVCCDTGCSESCDVCAASLGAAADGACTPAPVSVVGTPPCLPFACNGVLPTCPISCTTDAHCAPGYYCAAGGTCQSQKGQGAVCNSAAGSDCLTPDCRVCATGQCVDGYCCDKPCNGPCDVCSAALGAAGDGTCSLAPPGWVGVPMCSPYVCTGSEGNCGVSCSSDAQCASGFWCDTATQSCKSPQSIGASCATSSQCLSGACADGVCCDSACTDPCRACAASLKQSGVDSGTCGDAKVDTDPHDRCTDEGAASCKHDGFCNGNGACRNYAAATSCGVGGVCEANVAIGLLCDGFGSCQPNAGVECSPGKCVDGSCQSSCMTGADCAAGTWCKNGACTVKSAQGESCHSSEECGSTAEFCVDGYCCNAPCLGQCEACDVDQGHGSCVPVSGEPHNARLVCSTGSADDMCAEATCDGTVRDSCLGFVAGPAYVCRPAGCTDSVAVFQATCVGKGKCPDIETKACAPYVCDTDKCKDTCATDQDCVSGNECDTTKHQCKGVAAVCDGDHTLTSSQGAPQDCSPYRCAASNVCLNSCTSRADCVDGMSCTVDGRCEPPSANESGETGCGCRTAGEPRSGTGAALLIALGVLFGARRRRAYGTADTIGKIEPFTSTANCSATTCASTPTSGHPIRFQPRARRSRSSDESSYYCPVQEESHPDPIPMK